MPEYMTHPCHSCVLRELAYRNKRVRPGFKVVGPDPDGRFYEVPSEQEPATTKPESEGP